MVTALKWNALGNRLYAGDDSGKVSAAKISSNLVKVYSNTRFKIRYLSKFFF